MPHYIFEARIRKRVDGPVCGIDEVGRGPLAGPVVAAAVILPEKLPRSLRYVIADSKKLPREKREQYAERLVESARFGIGAASVAEIDRHKILRASFIAMARALKALSALGPA